MLALLLSPVKEVKRCVAVVLHFQYILRNENSKDSSVKRLSPDAFRWTFAHYVIFSV